MASKRPIIAIGPESSDIESILNQTIRERILDMTKLRTPQQLEQHFEAYKTKQFTCGFNRVRHL